MTEKKCCDMKHETFAFYFRKKPPMLGKVKLGLDDFQSQESSTLKVLEIRHFLIII